MVRGTVILDQAAPETGELSLADHIQPGRWRPADEANPPDRMTPTHHDLRPLTESRGNDAHHRIPLPDRRRLHWWIAARDLDGDDCDEGDVMAVSEEHRNRVRQHLEQQQMLVRLKVRAGYYRCGVLCIYKGRYWSVYHEDKYLSRHRTLDEAHWWAQHNQPKEIT